MRTNHYFLHIVLFLATLGTTWLAGAELGTGHSLWGGLEWEEIGSGWVFSLCFLAFLTAHEFGHYFMALHYRVACTLPYYIPVYIPIPGLLNIGSLGAVIRLQSLPQTRRQFFDIGVAGPFAGAVVSLLLLTLGFLTLPPLNPWLDSIHPEYSAWFGTRIPSAEELAAQSGEVVSVGGNLLFRFMAWLIPCDPGRVPPGHELMHNPLLFVGFLTLFFTALNLLPIGQLDGGHVVYGLFGRKVHGWVSRGTVVGLLIMGGWGVMVWPEYEAASFGSWTNYFLLEWGMLATYVLVCRYVCLGITGPGRQREGHLLAVGVLAVLLAVAWVFPKAESNPIWLVYAILSIRGIGLDHPAAWSDEPLDRKRKWMAYGAILLFILSFVPDPLRVVTG